MSDAEAPEHQTAAAFLSTLLWLDGQPLVIEPYRLAVLLAFLDDKDSTGAPVYNLCLAGRGKKNAKSLDLVLACLAALLDDTEYVSGRQVYIIANDKDQASADLVLAKKLIAANQHLAGALDVQADTITRNDGGGFLQVLPKDAPGSHGLTYRLLCYDEIHAYRRQDYAMLEALQPDPTRPEAQQWVTTYASLFHQPGYPLYDLMARGKAGSDPRMLFSWYGGDYTTDPAAAGLTPEERANPSSATWAPGYLEQQKARLPSHIFRRLHLNLPGLPEGSAFTFDTIDKVVLRGVPLAAPEPGRKYVAFVDMSGGSHDNCTLCVGYLDGVDVRAVRLVDQGQPAPFDPNLVPPLFAAVLKEYGCASVHGDAYSGQTFGRQFLALGIEYHVDIRSASEHYTRLEPMLNANRVAWVDVPELEQEMLGLVWKGGKITHPGGEFDDRANSLAGMVSHAAPRGVATGTPDITGSGAWDRAQQVRIAEQTVGWLAKLAAQIARQPECGKTAAECQRLMDEHEDPDMKRRAAEAYYTKGTMAERMQRSGLRGGSLIADMESDDEWAERPD